MILTTRNNHYTHARGQNFCANFVPGAYIVKNTITGGKNAGIAVGSSSYALIGDHPESGVSQGNTIQSAENGIKVYDSSHAKLIGNTANNNSQIGL